MSKACKSNDFPVITSRESSGKRVSNTLVTYLEVGNNTAKAVLIPDVLRG